MDAVNILYCIMAALGLWFIERKDPSLERWKMVITVMRKMLMDIFSLTSPVANLFILNRNLPLITNLENPP